MINEVPILKRLYPGIKKRLAKLFWRGGYSIVSSGGSLFLLNYRNFVDREIAFYDDYETEQFSYFTKLMSEQGCDLFLDIGANIGFYSVHVGRSRLANQIIAFEPDPRNVNQLSANLLINQLTGRVEIVAKAVSNVESELPFQFFPDTSTGQSRVDEVILEDSR